jgi:hypothetical protein
MLKFTFGSGATAKRREGLAQPAFAEALRRSVERARRVSEP